MSRIICRLLGHVPVASYDMFDDDLLNPRLFYNCSRCGVRLVRKERT